MATLTVLKGANQGTVLPLDGEKIVFGRNADCQVVLNEPAVSREHAIIRRHQGKFFIEDLKSRNKTFVNEAAVKDRLQLKDGDRIKICDNHFEFREKPPRPELPPDLRATVAGTAEDDDQESSSSTVEASLSHSSKRILETQPADRLAFLIEVIGDLTQTLELDHLLPKIVDSLFHVFRHADRGFLILSEEDGKRLTPTVVKTRRPQDESRASFSKGIVRRCLEKGEALLSEDATTDKQFDLSQSIADCKIRSVICAPLVARSSGKSLGVLQLDTQDRTKKFTQDDLRLLVAVAGQAAIALENARMHESLVARAGLERDLKLAHQVQLSFLPKKPPQIAGYDFYAHYEPAQEVGGDYYDFIPMPNHKLAVMIGDVAGKGVPAALLMAKVSSAARFFMLTENTLAEAIYKLNEEMQEAALLDRFVTLTGALLDPLTHQVTFVNAGHVPAMVYRKATSKVTKETQDLAGFPLGVADGIPYDVLTITLNPGDYVALVTDGVPDARDPRELEFTLPRTVATLEGTPAPAMPRTAGPRLVNAVTQHAQGRKAFDDITVVAFGRMA